ncbi:MerR family transcriptional regulator [Salinactinospora qingdaonensis]|uniref:MerR family transcriptional regulator n=1 Tax=Salinactinospora qingdaonensis TaxID=702744 RepID=A0ABP7GCW8_9ACTN
MDAAEPEVMRIGELARRAEVTPRTIRHYEELGLLSPGERASSGYRYYTERELARLNKIGQLKDLGLTLEEIGSVIDLYFTDPTGAQGKRKVLQILRGHLSQTQARRESLERFERELKENIAKVERLLAEAESGQP